MKLVIFGAGSIGCYVGGKLAAAGLDVTFYGRQRMAGPLLKHGITLTHYQDASVHIKDISYCTDLKKIPSTELIVLCVKSQDTQAAAEEIAKHFQSSIPVLSLQNGVDNVHILKAALPGRKIYGGMVPYNVLNMGKGRFHQGTEGALVFEHTAQTQALADALGGGANAETTDDIAGVQWSKLLINLNNALNMLSDMPLKAQFSQKGYRLVWADMIGEGLSVLDKAGIRPANFGKTSPQKMCTLLRLPNFLFTPIMAMRIKIDPQARSSMWEDLQQGRPSEIDYLQGALCALGKKIGVGTPVNDKVYSLVQKAFKAGASPALSGHEIRGLLAQKT